MARRRDTGRIRDDDAVAEVQSRVGFGADVKTFSGEKLAGYAARMKKRGMFSNFIHLDELKYAQRHTDAYFQQGPICVGCGTATAIQFSWLHSIASRGVYGRPVRVCVGPIYSASRNDQRAGNGRLRGQEGSWGSWAAWVVHDKGALASDDATGNYRLGTFEDDNAFALRYADRQVPQAIINAMKPIKIRCFAVKTGNQLFDAAMAGYAMSWCDDYTFGRKDSRGISRMNSPASHCTAIGIGAAVSVGGDDLVGGRQSWGNGDPAGPMTLRHKEGATPMAPGMTFVRVAELHERLQRGAECWAFQVVEGWR